MGRNLEHGPGDLQWQPPDMQVFLRKRHERIEAGFPEEKVLGICDINQEAALRILEGAINWPVESY